MEATKILAKIAADRNIMLVDLHSSYAVDNILPDSMSDDGLHLTSEAYTLWYEAIKEYIK